MKNALAICASIVFSFSLSSGETNFDVFFDTSFFDDVQALRKERIIVENILRGESSDVPLESLANSVNGKTMNSISSLIYARKLIALGKTKEAIPRLIALIDKPFVALEALYCFANIELPYPIISECHAKLLPLSFHGGMYGTESIGRPNFPSDYGPYNVPVNNAAHFFKIAELFEEAGLRDYSYYSFLEYMYSFLGGAVTDYKGVRIPASPKIIFIWRRAAKNAFKAGMLDEALSCIAKAMIYGDEKEYQDVLAEVQSWSDDDAEDRREIDAEEQGKLLLEIITLYIEIGAHPRAISLIDAHPKLFRDPDDTKRNVQQDWIKLVDGMKPLRKKLVLYGTEVWPDGDPLTVAIPWPCSKEARIEVRNILERAIPIS